MKKKILKISLIILTLNITLFFNNIENVKGDTPTCSTDYHVHTNYYFFIAAFPTNTYFDNIVNDKSNYCNAGHSLANECDFEFKSVFSGEIPSGSDLSTATYTWLQENDEGWTKNKFIDTFFNTNLSNLNSNVVKHSNTEWYYSHNTELIPFMYPDTQSSFTIDRNWINSSKSSLSLVKSATYWPHTGQNANISGPEVKPQENTQYVWGRTVRFVRDIDNLNYIKSTGSSYIWYPALYKIQFCVKNTTQTSTKHTLKVQYIDNEGNSLKSNSTSQYDEGETYNISCPPINGYTLTSNSTISGTMVAADKTLNCKYKKNSNNNTNDNTTTNNQTNTQTFTLKTMHYIEGTNIQIAKTETQTKNSGEEYEVICKDSITYEGNQYIPTGKPTNHAGTMNGNIIVRCDYTSNSIDTADISIILVWIIGGGALIYSIYSFRKNYKEQN